MEQLICHLFGDYIIQSDWMAQNKTRSSLAALAHAVTYALPFLLLSPSITALAVIIGTHFLIDRFRLARYVVWFKNLMTPEGSKEGDTWIFPAKLAWENCKATGYPLETPPFLAVWLLIIADNAIHLLVNFLALKYL